MRIYFWFPPHNSVPFSFADSPFPGNAWNSVTSSAKTPSSSPFLRIAPANGCSLLASSAYAKRSSSSSLIPSDGMMSVTFGSPLVIVPVLSNATICIFPVSSRDTAVLNIIPCFAPIPFPTIMATGVASPRAHGQLITRTEIPLARANPAVCPAKSHTQIVTAAMEITNGTKIPDTRSAILAIGALVAAASLTIWIICDKVVSSPTLVARHRINPD